MERIGPLAYRLALPRELSQIHDVFHVSILRRYRSNPSYIVEVLDIEISNKVDNRIQITNIELIAMINAIVLSDLTNS